MKQIPQEQLAKMDLASAEAELSNRVYEAACFLEELENSGRLNGNGHHAAQVVADNAVHELRLRWHDQVEVEGRAHTHPVPRTPLQRGPGPGPVLMTKDGWATAAPTRRTPLSPGSTIE